MAAVLIMVNCVMCSARAEADVATVTKRGGAQQMVSWSVQVPTKTVWGTRISDINTWVEAFCRLNTSVKVSD